MNIAVIIAGGTGSRMNSDIPKQFIEVNGKPIIIYTMEAFQRHEEIDAIEVVCLADWIEEMWSLAHKYKISKLKWVVPGGPSGQASCRNGLIHLEGKIKSDDIVIIHDSIRPIIPKLIINDLLRVARLKGNACASLPVHETMVYTSDQISGDKSIDRTTVRRVQTPQAYHFKELLDVHKAALAKGITNSVYANTMMIDFNKPIYFSLGFDNNLKITTSEDLTLFKALLLMPEEELVKK